jgi:hypothetical protein
VIITYLQVVREGLEAKQHTNKESTVTQRQAEAARQIERTGVVKWDNAQAWEKQLRIEPMHKAEGERVYGFQTRLPQSKEAAEYRIDVEPLSLPTQTPPPPPTPANQPHDSTSTPPAQLGYEASTKALISELFSQWPAPREDVYAANVQYYGNVVSRKEVLEDKQKFMARWPQRKYVIQSLGVQCAMDNKAGGMVCWATVYAAWDVKNTGTGLRGTVRAFYRILWDGNGSSGPKILSETSEVISREKRQENIDTHVADWIAQMFKN